MELFEKYSLRDGTVGWIVEILGDNEAYMFEVDKQGLDDRVIFVEKDDLDKKMVTE